MRTDENMRPKHFPVSLWFIIIGAAVLLIGIISYNVTGGISHYVKLENIYEENDASQISSIDVDINTAQITILSSPDTNVVTVDAKNIPEKKLGLSVEDDTLKVYNKNEKKGKIHFVGFSYVDYMLKDAEITITVPDKLYDSFEVKTGGGTADISSITTDSAVFEFGAGDTNVNDSSFGELKIEAGTGDFKFSNCISGSTDIECGTGNFVYSGEINGNSKIDCGVGNLELKLAASYDDYDIDIDKGIGDVDINKGSLPSTGRNISLDIDCGVGNVDIFFE